MGIADRRQSAVGELQNIPVICTTHAVDEVVFCLPKEQTETADEVRHILQDMGSRYGWCPMVPCSCRYGMS